jgi:hypothetical protein
VRAMEQIRSIGFIFLLLIQPVQTAVSPPAPDFSRYPKSEAFASFLSKQTDAVWHLKERNNLLAVTCFYGSDKSALLYHVTMTGQESDWREVYDWASQAAHYKQLSDAELKNLRRAISKLPQESSLPDLDRLMIVSFRESNKWTTRAYDRKALPGAMHRIFEIIGERFETKDKN